MPYDLTPMKAPRAAGALLRTLVGLVENPVTGGALCRKLLDDAGILAVRSCPATERLPVGPAVPGFCPGEGAQGRGPVPSDALPKAASVRAPWPTAADFEGAYRTGETTPSDVAERVIRAQSALEERTPSMGLFIRRDPDDLRAQAEASSARWAAGAPLGPLDGVPVAVKDELDQAGYPTTVGTSFLGKEVATEDATVVARLRQAGALLMGKANMQEIGIGVTGINPHHGAARNPYDPTRVTGGSSSASAAAVAAGLCPISVGADGGGAIRIPAGLCGVVGIKGTWGRLSEHGAAPLCWSVAHVGPLAGTVRDCALAYGIMAGPDPADPNTALQPQAHLDGWADRDLAGLRVGIFDAWFDDAEPAVVEACRSAVGHLVEAGAQVVPIEIPELGLLKAVHLVTIVGEMAASQLLHHRAHRKRYGHDTRLALALARSLRAYDYVQAQRHRVRLEGHFRRVLDTCDVIATPTCGRTAPRIARDALVTGESNLPVTDQIMRFAPAANLTGLPAISVPVGYDGDGLPIGLQLMGRAWEEHVLLCMAAVVEEATEAQAPQVEVHVLAASPDGP